MVLYEDLPLKLKSEHIDLDFALYDDSEAVSFFTGYRENRRGFRVILKTKDNLDTILQQKEIYDELRSRVVLASDCFQAKHAQKIEPVENVASPTYKEVHIDSPLESVLEKFLDERRKKNEFLHLWFADIGGIWSYEVKGHDGVYIHHGVCQVLLSQSEIVINGIRARTTKRDLATDSVTSQSENCPWQTDSVDLENAGLINFTYEINLPNESEPVRGECRCTIGEDKKGMCGTICLTYPFKEAVKGDVRFFRNEKLLPLNLENAAKLVVDELNAKDKARDS